MTNMVAINLNLMEITTTEDGSMPGYVDNVIK
jgi:hypothetical protein